MSAKNVSFFIIIIVVFGNYLLLIILGSDRIEYILDLQNVHTLER